MNQIGLQLENNVENIKLREMHWDGCLEDKERRKIFDVCYEKLIDNLDPTIKQRWLIKLDEFTLNGDLDCRLDNSLNFNYNLNELIKLNGAKSYSNEHAGSENSGKSNINNKVSSKNHHHQFKNQQQFSLEHNNTINQFRIMGNMKLNNDDKQLNCPIKWPGVEQVIESFYEYKTGLCF